MPFPVLLNIINHTYLPLIIGESLDAVVTKMGEPDDVLNTKKKDINILKYGSLQIHFFENTLERYTVLYTKNQVGFEEMTVFLKQQKIIYTLKNSVFSCEIIEINPNITLYFQDNGFLQAISVGRTF